MTNLIIADGDGVSGSGGGADGRPSQPAERGLWRQSGDNCSWDSVAGSVIDEAADIELGARANAARERIFSVSVQRPYT